MLYNSIQNVKYSDFLSELNKFVSLKYKINNQTLPIIQSKLVFFKNLSEIKRIPVCYKLLQEKFMKKIIKLYVYFPNLIQELLEEIYNTFNFEMYCPNIFIKSIVNLIYYYGIGLNLSTTRIKKNDIENLFDEIIYLKTIWSDLISRKDTLNEDFNDYLNQYEEIKLDYEKMKNQFDDFTKDFFTTELFPLFENFKSQLNKNLSSDNLYSSPKETQEKLKNIPLKNRTFFYKNEKLIFGEDLYTEFKYYFFPLKNDKIEELKKQICSFLNSKGGRIYIGISDSKIVKGIVMDYKKRDLIRNEIINYTYDFFPKCRTNKIDILFIPIKDNEDNYENNLFVIKIIVHQGETDKLYSMTEKGYNAYLRLPGQCAYLTALEIKDEIIKRNNNPEKALDDTEFQDPEPDNPELNELNIKNKKSKLIPQKDYYYYNTSDSYYSENEDSEISSNDEMEDYYYGNQRNQKRKKNTRKKNVYVVKIITFGTSPTIKKLEYIFQNVQYCQKKFLIKEGRVHGFLNFTNLQYAQNIIIQYDNCFYDGCGVRLVLQYNQKDI